MHVRSRFGDASHESIVVRRGDSSSPVESNSGGRAVNDTCIDSVIVIDDDTRFSSRVADYLGRAHCSVRAFPLSLEALINAIELRPDFFLIDICPNGRPIWEYLSTGISQFDAAKFVVTTMYPSAAFAAECIRRGAVDFIPKPISAEAVWLSLMGRKAGRPISEPLRLPTLADIEWEYIRHVLRLMDGNVTRAANLLGIRRQSLQRKLRILPPYDRR